MSTAGRTNAAPTVHLELGAGFALLCALVYFFGGGGTLAALLAAIIVHELGHLLLLLFFGAQPLRLGSAASGLEMDYAGELTLLQETLAALAGPAFGLLFAVFCALLGQKLQNEFLLLCAGLGFMLSVFNLLPARPLDGGRALGFVLQALLSEAAARRALRLSGFAVCILLALTGLIGVARGLSPVPLVAGLWLFLLQQKNT